MKKLSSPTSSIVDPAETLAAIGPVARSSVVDAVSERLQNEILAGRIAPGSKLPSERELSLALGVNRLTLRAALARLEAMGLVHTRHGSGTEVASWRERAGFEALPMVLSSLDRAEPAWLTLLSSLLEVRRVLVSEAVALAAERRTDADLVAIEQAAAAQANYVHDLVLFARGDLALQRAIVRAAGNVGFELMLNTFARFPEEHPELLEELYDRLEESLPFYDVLVELVRAGDPDVARTTLRAAFAAMDDEWLARHGERTRSQRATEARRAPPDALATPERPEPDDGPNKGAAKIAAKKSRAR